MNKKFGIRLLSAHSANERSKIQNRKWLGPLTIIIALSMWCAVASAQLSKLTIGNNTLSAAGLPAWMAKESGIFQKNGLDVQIVYFRGGTITTMSLIARETPISQVSGPPMVSAALKGARCGNHRRRQRDRGVLAHEQGRDQDL